MARARKSWREKLEDDRDLPKVVRVSPAMRRRQGVATMVIPRPRDVDALVRTIRKGRLITIGQIRSRLAREHGAETTCPLCTGIFLRIVSEVAEQDLAEGKNRVAPYWRVVRDDGSLNPKFPGGTAAQAKRLRAEGHSIGRAHGAKPPAVLGFENRLGRLAG